MPYELKKTGEGFGVKGPSGMHSSNTSLQKAQAQMRLLRGIEHGWKPTGKKPRKKRTMGMGLM